LIELPDPPYPPAPRHPPAGRPRRAVNPPVGRVVGPVGHLIGVALFVAVPAAAVLGAVALLTAQETSLILRIGGFVVCTALAFLTLKSLLPRRRQPPPAVTAVDPTEQPLAYAFVARVARDLGVPAPRQLVIGSGTELRLGGRRSLLDLFRTPRWELFVGLWLWHAVTLSEFQALVARTLAPMAGGRAERFRSTVRALLDVLTFGVDRIDEAAGHSDSVLARLAGFVGSLHAGVTYPVRIAGRLLLRLDPVREDALADDLDAVRVAGSDALVHAVLRSDFAAAGLGEADDLLDAAARAGLWTADLYAHMPDGLAAVRTAHNDMTLGDAPVLRGPTAGKHTEVFDPGRHYLSKMWSGFPPPEEREQNAKRDFVPAERDDRPAAELLADRERLRERLTVLRYRDVFETNTDYLPIPAETVRRWLANRDEGPLPPRYAGSYLPARKIDPGAPEERTAALTGDPWDDVRLVHTARNLYERAGERAAAWRSGRAALDNILQRTAYQPTGRNRALADDLEDDLRKAGRWLAALDRWAYVVHVHMAARLPDLGMHDELIARYESVLRVQPLAVDAGGYRRRVSAFARRLAAVAGHTPYRLARDAAQEFAASRKDLEAFLAEAAAIRDPLLAEWTGDVPLGQFLYSHVRRPPKRARGTATYGRRLLDAWDEIAGKSQWLARLSVAALLELHERIEREFEGHVSGATFPLPGETGDGVRLPDLDDTDEIEIEPSGPSEPDFVEEVPPTPASDDEANPWGDER
jgi:hypothetical protein